MKNLKIKNTLIALLFIAIGLILGKLLFSESASSNEHLHNDNVSSVSEWTCSMHPQIRQNEPGDCPLCGMDLIPVGQEADDEPLNAVRMSATAMKLADIHTMKIVPLNSSKSLQLTGKIQPNEKHIFTQTSHIGGRIEQLVVDYEGQFIQKGQIIAYIYSPDLVTTQNELLEAAISRESLPQLYEATIKKLQNWKVTEQQINEIVSKKSPILRFPIQADYSGYISRKMVLEGDHIALGEPIYEVTDLSRLWVELDVYEQDLSWIKVGDIVKINTTGNNELNLEGKVSFISPFVNNDTRVAIARVEIDNRNMLLKPKMFVTANVQSKLSDKSQDMVVVPSSAVMWTGKRSLVYIKYEDEKGVYFKPRLVTLGERVDGGYLVKVGVQIGDEIAVNGTFSIDAAAQLAGKTSMMN